MAGVKPTPDLTYLDGILYFKFSTQSTVGLLVLTTELMTIYTENAKQMAIAKHKKEQKTKQKLKLYCDTLDSIFNKNSAIAEMASSSWAIPIMA